MEEELEFKKCTAVTEYNKRCNKTVVNCSYHCKEHYEIAKNLYIKYKKICNEAYKLNLDRNIKDTSQQWNYLMKCYSTFKKAYDARSDHRKYAFVKECHDYGHNLQFKILRKKMELCERKLYEINSKTGNSIKPVYNFNNMIVYKNIYAEEKKEEDVVECNKKQQTRKSNNNNNINKNKIASKRKREHRQRKEKQSDEIIEKYIREKEEAIRIKNMIIDLIINLLDPIIFSLFGTNTHTAPYLMFYQLTHRLWELDYYKNFVPDRCNDPNCNCYAVYDLHLICKCAVYYYEPEGFFNSVNYESLKKFYKITLYNKEKIVDILRDIVLTYKLFRNGMIKKKFSLQWSNRLNRLKIKEVMKEEKQSKFLASMRLKKQLFMKKYEAELQDTDSDSDSDSESSTDDDKWR